jgi:hypothetical protein
MLRFLSPPTDEGFKCLVFACDLKFKSLEYKNQPRSFEQPLPIQNILSVFFCDTQVNHFLSSTRTIHLRNYSDFNFTEVAHMTEHFSIM